MTDHNTKMAAKEETVLRDNYDKLIEAAKHDLSWLARSFFTKGLLTKDNRDKVVRNRNGLGAALLVNCIETKVSVGNVQAFYTALDILKSKEGSACRDVALTMEVELRGERTTAQNTSRSTTATGKSSTVHRPDSSDNYLHVATVLICTRIVNYWVCAVEDKNGKMGYGRVL